MKCWLVQGLLMTSFLLPFSHFCMNIPELASQDAVGLSPSISHHFQSITMDIALLLRCTRYCELLATIDFLHLTGLKLGFDVSEMSDPQYAFALYRTALLKFQSLSLCQPITIHQTLEFVASEVMPGIRAPFLPEIGGLSPRGKLLLHQMKSLSLSISYCLLLGLFALTFRDPHFLESPVFTQGGPLSNLQMLYAFLINPQLFYDDIEHILELAKIRDEVANSLWCSWVKMQVFIRPIYNVPFIQVIFNFDSNSVTCFEADENCSLEDKLLKYIALPIQSKFLTALDYCGDVMVVFKQIAVFLVHYLRVYRVHKEKLNNSDDAIASSIMNMDEASIFNVLFHVDNLLLTLKSFPCHFPHLGLPSVTVPNSEEFVKSLSINSLSILSHLQQLLCKLHTSSVKKLLPIYLNIIKDSFFWQDDTSPAAIQLKMLLRRLSSSLPILDKLGLVLFMRLLSDLSVDYNAFVYTKRQSNEKNEDGDYSYHSDPVKNKAICSALRVQLDLVIVSSLLFKTCNFSLTATDWEGQVKFIEVNDKHKLQQGIQAIRRSYCSILDKAIDLFRVGEQIERRQVTASLLSDIGTLKVMALNVETKLRTVRRRIRRHESRTRNICRLEHNARSLKALESYLKVMLLSMNVV